MCRAPARQSRSPLGTPLGRTWGRLYFVSSVKWCGAYSVTWSIVDGAGSPSQSRYARQLSQGVILCTMYRRPMVYRIVFSWRTHWLSALSTDTERRRAKMSPTAPEYALVTRLAGRAVPYGVSITDQPCTHCLRRLAAQRPLQNGAAFVFQLSVFSRNRSMAWPTVQPGR